MQRDIRVYLAGPMFTSGRLDVLFRIPGESVGGAKEEIWAEAAGLVFARPLTMADVGPAISLLISMADAGKIVRRVG